MNRIRNQSTVAQAMALPQCSGLILLLVLLVGSPVQAQEEAQVGPGSRAGGARGMAADRVGEAGQDRGGPAVLDDEGGVEARRAAQLVDDTVIGASLVARPKEGPLPAFDPRCGTPRAAVEGLLRFLQPHRWDPTRAAACLQANSLRTGERQRRAQQIKEYLDGLGLYVDVDEIPAIADYRDGAGDSRYEPFVRYPELYVVLAKQANGQDAWLWSAETVNRIPALHTQAFAFSLETWARRLSPVWQKSAFGLRLWQALAVILLLAFAHFLRLFLAWAVGLQARGVMRRLQVQWGEKLLTDVRRPMGTLLAALFLHWALPALHLPVRLSQVVMIGARLLAAISAVWVVYKLVDLFASWMQQKAGQTETKLDDQLVPLIRRALKIVIVAFGAMFVLQSFNVNITGLIAGFSIGGVAFALAAKDTVANLFGSATIFASRPFQIGDWVNIAGTEGVVEGVGFRATQVRTFYNSLVSIPNYKVADAVVDNYGMREYRRCRILLGLTYDTPPERIQAFVEGVRAIIKRHPATRKDYYEVYFYEFAASSLNVLAYFFFKVPSWSEELEARHNIFLDFVRLADDIGVTFAFPTQTLHVESMPTGQDRLAAAMSDGELAVVVDEFGKGERGAALGKSLTKGYRVGD